MYRFLILSLLLLYSCGSSVKESIAVPDDLISEDKMVQLLSDVHLLEASLSIRAATAPQMHNHLPMEFRHDTLTPGIAPDPMKKDPLPYYNIFKRRDVTQKQYEATMAWYSAHPEKLSQLYDLVLIELSRRQAEDRTGKKAISGDSLKSKGK